MSNQFKIKTEEPEEEIVEREEVADKEVKEGGVTVFFRKLFVEGVVSKETATGVLPYLIFLCVLGMVYIANSHMAVKNIREIDKLSKEVKELSSEYKSLKADLMFKSKMTEVAKKVDTLGIKELIEPPQKLVIENEK
ncbi:FtsL-like putative cell division protein [Pedobacter sp.]|uniref:FtsL-like putative cell division protein n=1 Tax=Pedobacter sp. TaxID=1411316 RepID=UPI00396CEED0